MIALQHEHVTIPDCHLDIRGHVAEIRGNCDSYAIRLKNKTNRIGRVVRNREWGNSNISNGEAVARRKVFHPEKAAWVWRLLGGSTFFLFCFDFSGLLSRGQPLSVGEPLLRRHPTHPGPVRRRSEVDRHTEFV